MRVNVWHIVSIGSILFFSAGATMSHAATGDDINVDVVKLRFSQDEYWQISKQYRDGIISVWKVDECERIAQELEKKWNDDISYNQVVDALASDSEKKFSEEQLLKIKAFFESDAGQVFAKEDRSFLDSARAKMHGMFQSKLENFQRVYIKFKLNETSCDSSK